MNVLIEMFFEAMAP